MLLSSALIGAALLTLQPDPVRAPREAFGRCLHRVVDAAIQARKATDAFTTELAAACTAEERAYREAIIRSEMAARASRADAEEAARLEVDDARRNSRDNFIPPN
jgi:hypothetical protein